MEDKTLLRISLACSLIGILILIFISSKIELPITNINEINEKQLDQKIKIRGQITSINPLEDLTILTIEDQTGKIKAIIFNKINLEKNTRVEVKGTLTEYKGELEIIIDSIKEWS